MEDEGKAAVGRLRERLGKITAEIGQRNQGLEVPYVYTCCQRGSPTALPSNEPDSVLKPSRMIIVGLASSSIFKFTHCVLNTGVNSTRAHLHHLDVHYLSWPQNCAPLC